MVKTIAFGIAMDWQMALALALALAFGVVATLLLLAEYVLVRAARERTLERTRGTKDRPCLVG